MIKKKSKLTAEILFLSRDLEKNFIIRTIFIASVHERERLANEPVQQNILP